MTVEEAHALARRVFERQVGYIDKTQGPVVPVRTVLDMLMLACPEIELELEMLSNDRVALKARHRPEKRTT